MVLNCLYCGYQIMANALDVAKVVVAIEVLRPLDNG